MITMDELLRGKKYDELSKELRDNLSVLLHRINMVRREWGKPMVVTSCIRTEDEQLAIYAKKGITDRSKVPMGSAHLKGAAVDIGDPKGLLKDFMTGHNEEMLELCDLYMEDPKATVGWMHVQILPFKTYKAGGTRVFKP